MLLYTLAAVAAVVVLIGWGCQFVFAWALALRYPPRTRPQPSPADLPRAVVVLPLRGADPVLAECLAGLVAQDHPDFTVRVVVDSDVDQAWPLLREAISHLPAEKIRVEVLLAPLETCSLKVSAFLQATRDLPAGVGAVAILDADVVPPPHWLRTLIAPLADPAVGAASGVRWYHTAATNFGSVVRTLWGAGAATQMVGFDIPWGGTLAMSAELVRDPEMRRLWETSFVEDVAITARLRQTGKRLVHLPELTMLNAESISLAGCLRFVRRQMFCVRLQHPAWPMILAAGIAMAASVPLTAGVVAAAFAFGEDALAWALAAFALFVVVVGGLGFAWIDGYFYFGAPKDKPLAGMNWRVWPGIPLSIGLYLLALWGAATMTEVDWRGVKYKLGRDGRIRMLGHVPYTGDADAADKTRSLL